MNLKITFGDRSVFLLVILLLTFPFFFSAEHSPEFNNETTEKYSKQSLDDYLYTNELVFVYFSADWCVTCKINEANSINTKQTQTFMENNHIKVLKGDCANDDSEITKALEKYHRMACHCTCGLRRERAMPSFYRRYFCRLISLI